MTEAVQQEVELTPEQQAKKTEDIILEQALNDLSTSYKEMTNLITKMNSTAVRRCFLAAVSYPMDAEVLKTITKREDDMMLFTHARACIGASGLINNIYMKRHDVQEQINNLKEGEENVKTEQQTEQQA